MTTNNSRRTGLLIGGVILAIVLITTGLFLPPISLGQRLGLTGGDTTGADVALVQSVAPTTPVSGVALRGVDGVQVTGIAASDLAGSAEWAAAASAVPAGATLRSDVYALNYDGSAPTGAVAVAVPENARGEKRLDLVGWDGTQWQFMASTRDGDDMVSAEAPLPRAVAILQPAQRTTRAVAAEAVPAATLPASVLPLLDAVSVGTLTLAQDGSLLGEPAAVPFGSYRQLLRATNTGVVVDQVSLVNLLLSTDAQDAHITALVDRAFSGGYAGVNLDYQGVPAEQRAAFTDFVTRLDSALDAQGLDLVVTLATPLESTTGWVTGGQDWGALGRAADAVYVQMPLNPTAYADGGSAEQMVAWATGQVDRNRTRLLYTAEAIDSVGDSFIEMTGERAIANFGEISLNSDADAVEPATAVEAGLTGEVSPLEWDGAALTYRYSYQQSGQAHNVWLPSEAALAHRMRFADRYGVQGVVVRGLDTPGDDRFDVALQNYLGSAEAPTPVAVALLWTVRDGADSVIASGSGADLLDFVWGGAQDAGDYTIQVDVAAGEVLIPLDARTVTVASAEPEEPVTVAEAETPEPTATPEPEEESADSGADSPAFQPGDADAAINVAANLREGPGLSYPVIRVVDAGTRVSLIGRNSGSSWFQISTAEAEEGWIFGDLLNINAGVDRTALPIVQVDPPPVAAPAPGGGTTPAPAPAPVVGPAPITGGFELGGQVAGAPYSTMSYAGMTWVKKQHKFSPGNRGSDVAGLISEAHANGFKILLSIPGQPYPSSIDFADYIRFLGEVAALADPPDAIEVWNEQNIDFEWPNGQIDPASYVTNMLAPAYNAIKSRNSRIMVISGAPAPTGVNGAGVMSDDRYMAGMAAAGAANYMDCIGVHFNAGATSPSQSSGHAANSDHYSWYFWPTFNLYYNAFGGSRQLCFTELGFLSGEDYGGVPARFSWAGNTTVAQHASWLAEAVSLSAGSGKVRLLVIFNVDFTNWGDDPQAGYAMIRANGGCPACDQLATVMGR